MSGEAASIWNDSAKRWERAPMQFNPCLHTPPRAAAPTIPPYAKPHVPGAGALMDAAPTRDAGSTMADRLMRDDTNRRRACGAGPELLNILKALFAVVGARHLTPDTLNTYLRAKDLIERMEGGGA